MNSTICRCCHNPMPASIHPICEACDQIEDDFTNTEPNRIATFPAIGESDEAPKGLGRDGNKPLMRNRNADDMRSPIGMLPGTLYQIEDEEHPQSTMTFSPSVSQQRDSGKLVHTGALETPFISVLTRASRPVGCGSRRGEN